MASMAAPGTETASGEARKIPSDKQDGPSGAVAERLPIGVKLAYGMPNFAGAAMVIPIGIHMNIFYSDVVLVPLGYIALAIAVARSFDAITDPLMGWISDRTRTRWGRRRPWMFIGAPLCAVAFVLLFSPPEQMGARAAGVWFVGTFTLYFLFHTVYSIPHYGLGPELTLDYKERSSLFAWMEGFTLLGTLCASALPGLVLIPRFGDRVGFTVFACLFGGILTVLYWWQCYRIKERPDFSQREPNPLVPGVRRAMRNRPFRILLATYVVGNIAGAIPGLMMPYFTTYVLKPDHPEQWIGIFLVTYFGFAFLTLPGWLWAVRRFGKRPIYLISVLMAALASVLLFFQGEGDILSTFLILVWAGSSFGVRIFLGPSIQADVIDYDELYTGRRREAQYGALWAIMVKFIWIPSAAVPLGILAAVGYEPNIEQSETVEFTIRAIFGLAPSTFAVLAVLVFLFFPINERIHRAILDGIEKHKRGESAVDPFNSKVVPPPADRGIDEEVSWFLDHFSRRELERWIEGGSRVLVRSALIGTCVSLGIAAVALALVLPTLGNLSEKPGSLTVLEVVAAGFAMSAFLYHAVRVGAARRMRSRQIPRETVRSHLRITAELASLRPREDSSVSPSGRSARIPASATASRSTGWI
jgi:GPH family glycoside/pentoside/hexuronide:cation symporter